jgi:hypothetical protein
VPEHKSGRRYPGYDVLAKRHTRSWNAQTRRVIDARLSLGHNPKFFTEEEYSTVSAIVDRLVPQPKDRAPIPVAALVDHKLVSGRGDGYRIAGMPREQEAWRRGLAALDAEARHLHGGAFRELESNEQDALLQHAQQGELHGPDWKGMSSKDFFKSRLAHDVVLAYYSHPTSWSEIGWGGPASPRGYVRMNFDKRDPWEAAEVKHGDLAAARRTNRDVG